MLKTATSQCVMADQLREGRRVISRCPRQIVQEGSASHQHPCLELDVIDVIVAQDIERRVVEQVDQTRHCRARSPRKSAHGRKASVRLSTLCMGVL